MDDTDFRPFFDLVVGVLFVLLILVAAQLFFTRWQDVDQQQVDETKVLIEWERQGLAFLENLAARLRGQGFAVAVNGEDRSVILPISELVVTQAGGLPRIDERAGLLARTLAERLGCLPGSAITGVQGCPTADLLRIWQVSPQIRVDAVPPEAALPAERYGRLISTLLGASLLQTEPRLISITGAGGAPAFLSAGEVQLSSAAAPPGPLAGDVVLQFRFEAPAAPPAP